MSGFANEIIIHKSNIDDRMYVSFVGGGEYYTLVESKVEDCDTVDAAISMATHLEAATGLRWRLHDETTGLLKL